MVALAAISTLTLAGTASAGEGPDPVVLPDKSALPRDCVQLGDVSGRHTDETPRLDRAEAEAVNEARAKGATHVVTDSVGRCGGNSYCYEGVAYRCPAPGGPSSVR
jgi:hypothetical protein